MKYAREKNLSMVKVWELYFITLSTMSSGSFLPDTHLNFGI